MSYTEKLGLFKHDNPSTNTNKFNIDKALNENWDKVDNACGALEAKNTELEQYIEECDTAITALEDDNTTNKANIQALQAKETEHDTSIQTLQTNVQNLQLKDEEHDASIQELQTKNAELKAENEAYKRQLPAGQESGEYITLTDSSDLVFDELKVFGNSKQEKRSGKNKFDMSKVQRKTANGVTSTYNKENSTITFNGACTADNTNFVIQDMITAVKDKTTLTVYYVSGNCEIAKYAGLRLYDANWGQSLIVTFNDLVTSKVKSSTSTFSKELTNWNFRFDTGTVLNNFTIRVMLTDEVDTEYEQFGLAPSLDYKSEVEAVEEANIVVCNKNFLDIEKNANLTINGLTVTTNENGEITINETSTAQVYLKLYESKLEMGNHGNWNKKLLKKGAYTLSAKDIRGTASDDNFSVLIRPSTTSAESIAQLSRIPSATTAKKSSFELEEDTKLVVWAWLNKNITFTNFKFKLQLEQGNEETDYVANEQQNSTITAQQKMFEDDYFDLKNKKEVHVWKKKVLDGTEDYNISSASTDDYYAFQTVIGIDNDTATNKLYCEELAYDGFQGTEVKDYENIALNSSNKNLVRIWIKSSRLTAKTVVALKNYLSEHNITFYYKSIAPTSLACTETQIQQLEAIEKAHGYKTITNIYCTDSLSANMQVAYRKDLETYINNKDKEQDARLEAIEQLLTTTQTSALLLDNLEADLESEV